MSKKIYTKKGDGGYTSLIGGTKVSKADVRIEAYGTVDELNSWIGLVNDTIDSNPTLKAIQDRLFIMGALLAQEPKKQTKRGVPDLTEADIAILEKEMDRMNEALPDIKHFILPGGHIAVSTIHIARCVCRRAERCCVNLKVQDELVDSQIIKYLNRLSDYLFVLARYVGKSCNAPEVIWHPRK